MKRVVITGVGILSPIGLGQAEVDSSLRDRKSGIRHMPEFAELDGLGSHVAGIVTGEETARIPRKYRRSMGRVAELMALASMDAVEDSTLGPEEISQPMCGVSMGSTLGSAAMTEEIMSQYVSTRSIYGQKSTSFLQVMSHTCAANIAYLFSIKGRIIASSTACTSSSQSIGFGYEAIRSGAQEIMITGGADEMHWIATGTFDIMQGASYRYNHEPGKTPRPFDSDRDGLVVAEGAGCLILEELERAKKRGARIYAEVESFYTNSDGYHISSPSEDGMRRCIEGALENGKLNASDISYINAHATATTIGDTAEARATRAAFPSSPPVSSTKSYTGHTLGASGAIETIFSLIMMEKGYIAPTLNLDNIDPDCAGLDHVTEVRETRIERFMNNNFAFGGVNTSLIFRRYAS
ncbi:FIG138576: 3-oxoacyl-[ACP] synthase [hydrothermal vent metagenome]|uniref:FIG138576: 3-oxoacyl-[ACP] synthase n=1 Tax=hydrothermal vent metagenome TaxID=652676 RepID=A0A3B1BUP7_9ZZZZ